MELEYVWRQQDMRALRRALFWRDHTIRLYAALFVLAGFAVGHRKCTPGIDQVLPPCPADRPRHSSKTFL